MQQADFSRFKAVMAGMGRMFNCDLDAVLLDAYWLALRDWALPEFESAAGNLMGKCQFMPKPADFNALRDASQKQLASEAWAQVLDKIRSMSRQEVVTLSPQIDRAVRAMGGYGVLSLVTTEELPWRAKKFAELWDEFGEVEEARAALPHGVQMLGEMKRIA